MGRRVLIVDDSFGDRMVMRDLLLSIGYSIAGEAKDGREGIEKYRDLEPDLVIVDVAMKEMDGAMVARELTGIDPDATIIACAGQGQRVLAMEAVQAGAKDFVLKPLKLRALMKTVANVMRDKQRAA